MQAARGASLTPSDPDPGSGTVRPRRTWWIFAAVALTAYALDLATKQWALSALRSRDIEVLGDFLVLHLVFNPGAAFSLGTGSTFVLSILAIVAVSVVVFLSARLASPLWSVGLGLLLGGVGGNLTDRLVREPGVLRGHVIDWLMLPNWPVFNIADMCIIGAAVVIVVQTVRGITLAGERLHEAEDAE